MSPRWGYKDVVFVIISYKDVAPMELVFAIVGLQSRCFNSAKITWSTLFI
jgi:hypothetical protein